MQHFLLAVVEKAAVPVRVHAVALAGAEILSAGTVKIVQTFGHILDRVGVHHIQQHGNAESMSGIDEVLQIIRRAEAVAGRKEGGNMVAERAIVRVLLNGHNLHHVVPQFCHAGQHLIRKLAVAVDAPLLARHAHMSLIDERRLYIGWIPAGILPFVRLGGFPDDAAVVEGGGILLSVANPGGHAVVVRIIRPHHMNLDMLAMLQCICRQAQLPHAIRIAGHGISLAVPEIEIADKIHSPSPRGPLAVHPLSRSGITIESHAGVGFGKIHQRTMAAADALQLSIIQPHTPFDFAFKGSQPAICQH